MLVVDDEESVLTTLERVLQAKPDYNFDITTLRDSTQAAEILDSGEKFDLLMTDLRMQPLDGMELIERARPEKTEIRVIVVSAYLGDDIMKELEDKSVDACIRKPFRMTDIFSALDRVLA